MLPNTYLSDILRASVKDKHIDTVMDWIPASRVQQRRRLKMDRELLLWGTFASQVVWDLKKRPDASLELADKFSVRAFLRQEAHFKVVNVEHMTKLPRAEWRNGRRPEVLAVTVATQHDCHPSTVLSLQMYSNRVCPLIFPMAQWLLNPFLWYGGSKCVKLDRLFCSRTVTFIFSSGKSEEESSDYSRRPNYHAYQQLA